MLSHQFILTPSPSSLGSYGPVCDGQCVNSLVVLSAPDVNDRMKVSNASLILFASDCFAFLAVKAAHGQGEFPVGVKAVCKYIGNVF